MLSPKSFDKEHMRHFGLGWAIRNVGSRPRYSHGGSNKSGFRCYARFDLVGKTGIVIMTNAIGGRELHESLVIQIDQAVQLTVQ